MLGITLVNIIPAVKPSKTALPPAGIDTTRSIFWVRTSSCSCSRVAAEPPADAGGCAHSSDHALCWFFAAQPCPYVTVMLCHAMPCHAVQCPGVPCAVLCCAVLCCAVLCVQAFMYLTALGSGGIKPCVSSFGGDQFKDTSARERCV